MNSPTIAVRLFTIAVPFGIVTMMLNPIFAIDKEAHERDQLIKEITQLVVPIKNRPGSKP